MKKIIEEFCRKHNLTEEQFFGKQEIAGSLDLTPLTSIPEGFNPTVGGSLDLTSLTSIPEGFNPTVGGYLYLTSLTSIPEGFNPTVGGYLYLRSGLNCKTTNLPKNYQFSWQNGKYIMCDGILAEVLNKRKNYFKIKIAGKTDESFLVKGKYSAHGATLKQANSDLEFKIVSEKLKNAPIKEDTEFTVKYYRLLTGACDLGVRNWMEKNNIPFTIEDNNTVETKPIKAVDLLKILEKTNAYGLEKIKSLITF